MSGIHRALPVRPDPALAPLRRELRVPHAVHRPRGPRSIRAAPGSSRPAGAAPGLEREGHGTDGLH